jgi:hypothetical protein
MSTSAALTSNPGVRSALVLASCWFMKAAEQMGNLRNGTALVASLDAQNHFHVYEAAVRPAALEGRS